MANKTPSFHYVYDLNENLHSLEKQWFYKPCTFGCHKISQDGTTISAGMLPLKDIIALSKLQQGLGIELYDETGFRCGFVSGEHCVIR